MISNKKLNQIVTELFINEKKLKIYTIFIKHSFFAVPTDVKLKCSHFFYCENFNKSQLVIHQILTIKTYKKS